MRSMVMFGVVWVAATLLVFCEGDDGDNGQKSGSETEYNLKLDGIGAHVLTDTELKFTVEIRHDDALIDTGDVATTKLSLEIKCGEHQVALQEDMPATAGKVEFDTVRVEGEHFTGSCTAHVVAKIDGKDVSVEHEFRVGPEVAVMLPSAPTEDGEYVSPTADSAVVVGRPFMIISSRDLKVQPNEMCKGNLVLVYYDAKNNTAREVLTAGETIKSVDGAVAGLAVVKVRAEVNVADACTSTNEPASIVLAVSPGLPKGFRLEISEATDAPSLAGASLSDDSGKIKLDWTSVQNFSGGAEVFFNNATEGNEWTRHSDAALQWSNNGNVTSTLDYTLPVRALVKAVLSGGGVHLLLFSKDS